MSQPSNQQPRPSVGPTRASTLVVAALTAGAVAWLLISHFYYSVVESVPWLPALTFAALAVAEALAAFNTKARIDRRPGREPINALLVARLVVLAKASSLAGAIFAGYYGAVTVWLLLERQRTVAPAADLPAAIASLVASGLLIAAALWLERSCRIPDQPDESDETQSDQVR